MRRRLAGVGSSRGARGLRRAGVRQPWSHQARAAGLAHVGRDVVVATGTASGKSLAYQLPVLAALASDRRATALLPLTHEGTCRGPVAALAALTCRTCAPRPTTATPRSPSGTGPASTGGGCSAIPTCCTARCCPSTADGRATCAACATSCWTSATPTAGCSARMWRSCCAACCGSGPVRSAADDRAGVGDGGQPGGLRDTAGRARGRGRDRRRVARCRPHRRAVGAAPARRADGRERHAGAAFCGRGVGADAGGDLGHRRCAHAGLRPLPAAARS